jgi:uncharacterized membrane protein YeiB
VDGLGRFLDEQESMTRDRRSLDRGIAIIGDVLAREHEKNAKNEAGAFRAQGGILSNLYSRLAHLYFKRVMYESEEKRQETWALSKWAEQQAVALRAEMGEDE